jgi:hypothetical protein
MRGTSSHGWPALLLAAALGTVPVLAQERQAKPAVDDRADTHAPLSEVGKGTHFARKPLATGAYFNDGARAAVAKYYAAHPVKAAPARRKWQVGAALAKGAGRPVTGELLAALPKLPPGHAYLDVGGDVVLVASESRMVVDGIPAKPVR